MEFSFTDTELRNVHDFVIKLSIEAGHIMTRAFADSRKSYAEKSSQYDLVTETDSEVEKFLISSISERFPTHRFIGEEASAQQTNDLPTNRLTNEPTWMIDPIDGTMNFVHSHPNICLSIGLTPILGVIFNPIKNELYTARVGAGAYLNGKPIHVSAAKDMAHSLLMTEFGCNSDFMVEKHNIIVKIMQKLHGIRASGSAALNLALVASGAADVNYEFGLHCWDMAAGIIIVREAGGVVSDTTGGDVDVMSRRVLCAASEEIARQLAPLLDSSVFAFPRD